MLSFVALALAAMPPKPANDPNMWITPKDYPKTWIKSNDGGIISFVISVDKKGKPSYCMIRSSSGGRELDNLTCTLLMRRARFFPAKDENGIIAPSQFRSQITWNIARRKLITRGFEIIYVVNPKGRISNCEVKKYDFRDNNLQCNARMIGSMAKKLLPSPITSYKSISVILAMEVEQSTGSIPRPMDQDRILVSSANIGISASGEVITCTTDVTREWLGKSSDLCNGAMMVGAKEFAPDPEGKDRKLAVTLEMFGSKR